MRYHIVTAHVMTVFVVIVIDTCISNYSCSLRISGAFGFVLRVQINFWTNSNVLTLNN